jgi:type I restriction enzyme S subunit
MTSEWVTEPLQGVISYIAKGIPPAYVEKEGNNTVRILNQKCNRDFTINYSESRLHDLSKRSVPQEKYLRDEDILINSTGTGTAGRIAQLYTLPCPTLVDGHMIVLRGNQKICPRYLGYALKAQQPYVLQLDEGSTGQTELNRERLLSEVEVSYPVSLEEQEAIAATLSALDDKIANNRAINNHLEQMAQAIFKSWFVDFEPWGGVMPEGWREGTLGDICTYSKERIAVSVLTASTYISTENMQPNKAGFVDATSLPTINLTTAFRKGDVLVSNIRPYFKKIVYCDFDGGCSTDVLCFHPNTSMPASFLYCTLYGDLFFEYMVAGSKGTKMPRGDKTQIMQYSIVIPVDNIFAAFDKTIQPMLVETVAMKAENAHLTALRDMLLPRLMSGELEVRDD